VDSGACRRETHASASSASLATVARPPRVQLTRDVVDPAGEAPQLYEIAEVIPKDARLQSRRDARGR